MTLDIRLLNNQDYDSFEHFLKDYVATSMFMRSNAHRVGLEFKPGLDYSANYWAAFEQNQLKGLLVLNWNGNLFIQAPEDNILSKLFDFVQQTVGASYFIKSVLGPDHQAQQILAYLNPSPDNLSLSVTFVSYNLMLKNMTLLPQLKEGSWVCRLATHQDLDVLIPWVVAYGIEASNVALDKPDAYALAQEELHKRIDLGEIFVLEDQGRCVAKADYNATLPDIYQIGGVWTPPELRGRGYGRAVVGGALQAAHEKGVETGTLFTKNPAAMRAYESLGFRQVDHYHITLFKEAVCLIK
ncbi:MAG: GNAT family N-acetyltransferase [Janthinobacterium lividum]